MLKKIITSKNDLVWNTGFWESGKVIIPLFLNKNGDTKRLTLEDTNSFGAPVPSEEGEKKYRDWCLSNNRKYDPPLFSSTAVRKN